jgi:hypothetical protein
MFGKKFSQRHRPGLIGFGILVGIVVLVLVIGAVAYFASDPLRQRVDDAYRGATEWTPENIAADPSGYLSWAYGEMDRIEEDLQARQIALRRMVRETERDVDVEAAQVVRRETSLTTLKDIYRSAEAEAAWPVTVDSGQQMDEAEARALILQADKALQQSLEKIDRYEVAQTRINQELRNVEESLSLLQSQRGDLSHQIEMARLDETLRGYESLVDTVTSLTDTTAALAESSPNDLTIDDFAGDQVRVDAEADRRFAEIMAEG